MYMTDLYLSLILGLTIGLIFTEITGITPAVFTFNCSNYSLAFILSQRGDKS